MVVAKPMKAVSPKKKKPVSSDPQPYSPMMKVVPGDTVNHPSFGLGSVRWAADGHMCVVFDDKPRILVCRVF